MGLDEVGHVRLFSKKGVYDPQVLVRIQKFEKYSINIFLKIYFRMGLRAAIFFKF